MARVVV